MVPLPEVDDGIASHNDIGGVHVAEVPTPVAIVPDVLPHAYRKVCVNEVDALDTVNVTAEPIVVVPILTDEALGIVGNVKLPDTLTGP